MKQISPKILTDNTIIYARPNGYCYHLSRNCVMLQGGDFVRYGYKQITKEDVKSQGFLPCTCAYDEPNKGAVLHRK